jgi:nucleotide-binding universal stress UspA family protein
MKNIFERVVCGVDDSEAGHLAARLAARLADPGGSLSLVAVEDTSIAVHAGWQMAAVSTEVAGDARAALDHATELGQTEHAVTPRLLRGDPVNGLLAEIDRYEASLVVVGTHEFGRGVGIALRSVATHLLHEAPCSVLIARAPRNLDRWPRKLVVGLDGSPQSAVATRVARQLGERLGADVRAVAADGHADLDLARRSAADLEVLPGKPVDELIVLSEFSDLVVVGSRGLRGVRALGSVSERVAHQARSPVLVVRGA